MRTEEISNLNLKSPWFTFYIIIIVFGCLAHILTLNSTIGREMKKKLTATKYLKIKKESRSLVS